MSYIWVKNPTPEEVQRFNDKELVEFRKQYADEHKVCPKCGSNNYYSTCMAYFIVDIKDKDSYKDENDCECEDCGWQGIFHELKYD